MRHSDEAFAMMLLTLPLTPGPDSSVQPLSPRELASVAGRLDINSSMGLSALMGPDVSAVRRMLGVSEDTAYRLCVLMSRDMPLSRLLEDCAEKGTEILTPFDNMYPEGIKNRLGKYFSPALFVKGNPDLLSGKYLGVLGIPGVKTEESTREGLRALVAGAAENGYGVFTGGENGACRVVREYALDNEARLAAALTGGLEAFGAKTRRQIESGCVCAVSVAHPEADESAGDAAERNRLIFAGSLAVFAVTTDLKRGEADAARHRLCDHLYACRECGEALPYLTQRGYEPVEELTSFDVSARAGMWNDSDVQQLSLF